MLSKLWTHTKRLVGISVMLVIVAVFVVVFVTPFHRWFAQEVATRLSARIHSRVEIGIIAPALPHRIVVEDLCIYDQQDDTLIAVAHVEASVNLLSLLQGNLVITDAQLYGYDVRAYQPDSLPVPNYQFLLDAFANQEPASEPLRLQCDRLMARNGSIQYQSLRLTDLELEGSLSLVPVPELVEGQPSATSDVDFTIERLQCTLKRSRLLLSASKQRDALRLKVADTHIVPADFSSLVAAIQHLPPALRDENIAVSFVLSGQSLATFRIDSCQVHAPSVDAELAAEVAMNMTDSTATLTDAYIQIKDMGLESSDWFEDLGWITFRGDVSMKDFSRDMIPADFSASLQTQTENGDVAIEAHVEAKDKFLLHLATSDLDLHRLLHPFADVPLEHLTMMANLDGSLKQETVGGEIHVGRFQIFEKNITNLSSQVAYSPEHLSAVVKGDFIEAEAWGRFEFPAPASHEQKLQLSMQLKQAPFIDEIFHGKLNIIEPIRVEADVNVDVDVDTDTMIALRVMAPSCSYDGIPIQHLCLTANSVNDVIHGNLSAKSPTEKDTLSLSLAATAHDKQLSSALHWRGAPDFYGDLSLSAFFDRDSLDKLSTSIHVNPTTFVLGDTVWNMHPSDIVLSSNALDVNGVTLVQNHGPFIQVDGRVSDDPQDSLTINLNDINLSYVMNMARFRALALGGAVTGKAVVHHLGSNPSVGSQLHIHDLTINKGKMGNFDVNLGWGRKAPQAIDFSGTILEPNRGERSTLDGTVDLQQQNMDLYIGAHNLNLDFLNHFTKNFFNNLHARTTGLCRIYGPLSQIDLQGDMKLDTFAVTIDAVGARYHALPGDSILLRSGEIEFRHVHILDDYHLTDARLHAGEVNGLVTHTKLRKFHYDVNIDTHDILTYDHRQQGELSGLAFTEGKIGITGNPNLLEVNINVTPTRGSFFAYDLTTPGATTDNEFIHFVSHPLTSPNSSVVNHQPSTVNRQPSVVPNRDDTRVNFHVNATPDIAVKFKMGANGSDDITLYGNGNLHATYFNKGDFQIFGTYRVDNGTYQLSLQDVIRKDFQFQQGGTLVFGGNPEKATLNLQAVHTVSGVSLNDLTTTSNFSKGTVRVNCLLNILGTPATPQLNFDFDIPNVNEDEKQMIRSMIATEEERNMQIIYLLGLGRFYTYDATNQTNTAMQGLLSSTLSGQLNNILSSAIGSSNWNLGTTFSTGTQGWTDMDVEGMLSGRLLDNRLLINGTFGYRNTPISNSNFIGDFDVEWFFTKSRNLSLKAYSETNDRYFTKSALTTQGIGLKIQKDFRNMRDLFGIKRTTTKSKQHK